MAIAKSVNKTILINTSTSKVWEILTKPEFFKIWLSEFTIDIISNWKAGSPIKFIGKWYGSEHCDKGTILVFDLKKVFKYNYWSEISELPDETKYYTVIEFILKQENNTTLLSLNHSNFENEVMYKHAEFYWNSTLDIIRKLAENTDK